MKAYLGFITFACTITFIFLGVTNWLTTPHTLWFVHTILPLLLFIITVYCMSKKAYTLHATLCSLVLISYLAYHNIIDSPEVFWLPYPLFPLVAWPIIMAVRHQLRAFPVAVIGSICTIVYYGMLNMSLSPGYPWVIYPTYAVLWWPLTLFHIRKRTFMSFSVTSSLFSIVFFITVNIVSTPHTIWCIYPIFAILWWPLTVYIFVYKKKQCVDQ